MVSLQHLSRTAALKRQQQQKNAYHQFIIMAASEDESNTAWNIFPAERCGLVSWYKSVLLFRAQLFSFYSDYLGNKNNLLILRTE